MFTGLIEQCAVVLSNSRQGEARRLTIQSHWTDIHAGESIAVQGVCLTALADSSSAIDFDLSPETLARSNLADLISGQRVNLERAMSASGRFGGHYVSGHVDTTAFLASTRWVGDYLEMIITGFEECDILYLLPKGSITLDGVSLTINAVNQREIALMLVPHTLEHTRLGDYALGKRLNVEFDYMARLVAHQVKSMLSNPNLKIGPRS